jgi:hypothetical protein
MLCHRQDRTKRAPSMIGPERWTLLIWLAAFAAASATIFLLFL